MGDDLSPPGPERAGQIVILNGAPRAGKSSISAIAQRDFEGFWIALGVDIHVREMTPERYRPGIGLRPGGERPDLEVWLPRLYAGLYGAIAAHAEAGLNVIVDIGHHDAYSRPLGILSQCARRLAGLPVLFVGVRCGIETVMVRRNGGQAGREGQYLTGTGAVPGPVLAWQREVHCPGIYDLEVDTSNASPAVCAEAIRARLARGMKRPTAFEQLSKLNL